MIIYSTLVRFTVDFQCHGYCLRFAIEISVVPKEVDRGIVSSGAYISGCRNWTRRSRPGNIPFLFVRSSNTQVQVGELARRNCMQEKSAVFANNRILIRSREIIPCLIFQPNPG